MNDYDESVDELDRKMETLKFQTKKKQTQLNLQNKIYLSYTWSQRSTIKL